MVCSWYVCGVWFDLHVHGLCVAFGLTGVFTVPQVEVEEERKVPQFVLLVSLDTANRPPGGAEDGKKESPSATMPAGTGAKGKESSQGWAVQRTLDDFYTLHEKLTQVGAFVFWVTKCFSSFAVDVLW